MTLLHRKNPTNIDNSPSKILFQSIFTCWGIEFTTPTTTTATTDYNTTKFNNTSTPIKDYINKNYNNNAMFFVRKRSSSFKPLVHDDDDDDNEHKDNDDVREVEPVTKKPCCNDSDEFKVHKNDVIEKIIQENISKRVVTFAKPSEAIIYEVESYRIYKDELWGNINDVRTTATSIMHSLCTNRHIQEYCKTCNMAYYQLNVENRVSDILMDEIVVGVMNGYRTLERHTNESKRDRIAKIQIHVKSVLATQRKIQMSPASCLLMDDILCKHSMTSSNQSRRWAYAMGLVDEQVAYKTLLPFIHAVQRALEKSSKRSSSNNKKQKLLGITNNTNIKIKNIANNVKKVVTSKKVILKEKTNQNNNNNPPLLRRSVITVKNVFATTAGRE